MVAEEVVMEEVVMEVVMGVIEVGIYAHVRLVVLELKFVFGGGL